MPLYRCDEPIDVGTTKRRPLTPSQKLKLYEDQKGICPLCERRMERGERLVDEHLRPLALGGSNDLGGRAIVHGACADDKTHGKDGDLARIAKAKAQKRAALGFETAKRPLQGRGFRPAPPQRSATTPPEKWVGPALGRRTFLVPDNQKDACASWRLTTMRPQSLRPRVWWPCSGALLPTKGAQGREPQSRTCASSRSPRPALVSSRARWPHSAAPRPHPDPSDRRMRRDPPQSHRPDRACRRPRLGGGARRAVPAAAHPQLQASADLGADADLRSKLAAVEGGRDKAWDDAEASERAATWHFVSAENAAVERDEADSRAREAGARAERAEADIAKLTTLRPLNDWHEEDGFVLWWVLPVREPPYSGSPLCDDWPGYHTYWTPLVEPRQALSPESQGAERVNLEGA